jgi:YhcH/YjgK/YiaL family protein
MIVIDLDRVEEQVPMTQAFRKAVDFLRRPDLAVLPDGRVDIDGDRVFALPQRYNTVIQDPPRFECHRRYIDIQYLVQGCEVMGWAPAGRMQVSEAYDPSADIAFGTVPAGTATQVHLRAGQLAVLYPSDGHAPRLASGAPSPVFKIVVKVAVEEV